MHISTHIPQINALLWVAAYRSLATTDIDTIEIPISWTTLAGYLTGIIGKAPALISAFRNKDLKAVASTLAIPMEMKYSLYANGIYYESVPEKLM